MDGTAINLVHLLILGRVIYDSGIPERIRIPELIPDRNRIPEQFRNRSGIPERFRNRIRIWPLILR